VAEWDVPGYTELKALGSGGFGEVVLARHDGSGTRVAIKYLRRDLLADPEFAAMFRSEAEVLASLNDPNVVRLYEYVESPAGAAIVMELIDGVSLREILARQGQTTPEAALVVLQGSLLGLAAAHRRGVVHRDYKPENVLIDGAGASKLTDFGIAARAGDSPIPAGTLAYAPPEQFGGGPATPAGDVYAATATFYECLTGRPPFTGATTEMLLRQHLAEPVPLEPVPEPLRPLVAAGMAKDPGGRPADGATLVAELRAVAGGAYGPGWEDRGRSELGAAALLLAALWPTGAAPAVHGSAIQQVHLAQHPAQSPESRHLWHIRHLKHLAHLRRLRSLPGAIAVTATAAAVTAVAVLAATSGSSHPPSGPGAAPPPAIVYATTTSVVLRDGVGAPRILGTFPAGQGQDYILRQVPFLTWSPNGKEIAWLANGTLNLASVNGGPTRHWACAGCSSPAFQGDEVVTVPEDAAGGDFSEALPQLLVFPANGSAPLRESITGIPVGQIGNIAVPGGIDTDFLLLGDSPPGTPVVAYGDAGGSDAGGPQQLYRVNQAGHATPLGKAPSSRPVSGALGNLATDTSGDQVSFTTYSNSGACGGTEVAYVLDSLTGAVTVPAAPSGGGPFGFWVEGLWFDPAGTAYASFIPNLSDCATSGGPPPSPATPPTPIVCKLVGGQWVRTGAGALQADYAPGGWLAQRSGPGSLALPPTPLVISHGTTTITVPDVTTFAWAPTSSPAPSAVSSPVSSAVASPALPPRRQAAQALAALLAQSGTDRAAVTQAVSAVADCSAGLSQDETIFSNAASSRQALLGELAALPDRSALPASMLQDLTTAWQASGQADQDFANWAQDEISQGCSTNYQSDASYQAATVPDDQATKYKKAFAALWTAIAHQYGLPTYRYNQI
jgi:Protein kinase domain